MGKKWQVLFVASWLRDSVPNTMCEKAAFKARKALEAKWTMLCHHSLSLVLERQGLEAEAEAEARTKDPDPDPEESFSYFPRGSKGSRGYFSKGSKGSKGSKESNGCEGCIEQLEQLARERLRGLTLQELQMVKLAARDLVAQVKLEMLSKQLRAEAEAEKALKEAETQHGEKPKESESEDEVEAQAEAEAEESESEDETEAEAQGLKFSVFLPLCGTHPMVAAYPSRQAAAVAVKDALDADFTCPGPGIPKTLALLAIPSPWVRSKVNASYMKVPSEKTMPPTLHWILDDDGNVFEAVMSQGPYPYAFATVKEVED
jgi:hypothetical protein